MKTILYTSTLFYYDGVQVFEARDAIGGHYIAVLTESIDSIDRYILAGVEPEKLRQFRTGGLDLRTLLIKRVERDWFIAIPRNGFGAPLELELQTLTMDNNPDLPDSGFFLHDIQADTDTVQEARIRNNLVLEVAVEPPEAAEKHQIHAGTLAGLLSHLQTLVKHAYGAALRDMSAGARRATDMPDAHLLNVVVPAAAGSFRLVFEAASLADIFGHNALANALQRIDQFFEHVDNPKQTLEMVKHHRGHLAGAYLRMLRFLVEHKTGLSYTWAEPDYLSSKGYSVSNAEAISLVEYLSGIANIGAETVVLMGILEKADKGNGNWRIVTNEREYSGKIKDDGPSLDGLKIGSCYRFTCLEEIEESQSGREQRTLFLMEHEPA
jgi:hypothetical protein